MNAANHAGGMLIALKKSIADGIKVVKITIAAKHVRTNIIEAFK